MKEPKNWIAPIDGLRTIAALLVLACHASALPLPYGPAGVWLFFVLSAFLLTKPFVYADASGVWEILATFYIRRAFRILPMYAVYVVTYAVVTRDHDFIAAQLLRFQGFGHLWTINQELLFYALMPVFILLVLPFRRNPALCAVALIALAVLAETYLTVNIVSLPSVTSATSTYSPFFLAPFLLGMATAFALPTFSKLIERRQPGGSTTAVISLVLLILTAAPHIYAGLFYDAGTAGAEDKWPLRMALMYAPFLIWISICPGNWLTKALSFMPLRKIGEAGYSFYLWHMLVLLALRGVNHPEMFLPAVIITAVLARITFLVIERPFIAIGRRISATSTRVEAVDSVTG